MDAIDVPAQDLEAVVGKGGAATIVDEEDWRVEGRLVRPSPIFWLNKLRVGAAHCEKVVAVDKWCVCVC